MQRFELIVPCHFGLESVCKKEIHDLGYEVSLVSDGKVHFIGDAEAIVRANIFLRTGERVLIKLGSFHAESYEDLYQGTKALPLEEVLPVDASFWVTKASSVKSKLFSPRDIQSVMKKAMVDRLSGIYHLNTFSEDGAKYPFRVALFKDEVTVCLDSSGESLHKRGYRLKMGKAPIKETLAAALILLSKWREDEPFVDPMCGAGTFPIEAAMIAANIAPGMDRSFTAEEWENLIPKKEWYAAITEAEDMVDRHLLETKENRFGKMVDIAKMSQGKKHGVLMTNPPYGERIEDKRNLPLLYTELREAYEGLNDWQLFVITAYEQAEKYLGKSFKNRKIYNGMMKTYLYQYKGK